MSEIFSSETQFFNAETVNPAIVKYKVPIAFEGIANNFEFSKEVLNSMADSLKGVPVLTHFDGKQFGGHEDDLYSADGILKRTPELKPIGFSIYNQDNTWWETFNVNGEDKEFLTTYVYLWREKYPYIDKIPQLKVFQSMECEIDFNPLNGIKKVTSAKFNALALIGVKPAFEGSTFIRFSSDELDILKQEFEQSNIPPLKGGENKILTLKEKDGEKFSMEKFKALFTKMQEEQSKYSMDDSDDIVMLIDGDAQYIYILADGSVSKIPFVTTDGDDNTFTANEDQKEMCKASEMMSKMSKMFTLQKEKVVTEMSLQLSAKDAELESHKAEMSTKEAQMSEQLSAKDTEIGQAFASISSLETAMAESQTVMAERESQIAELSKQLKGKEVEEKMSQVDEFLSGKEFNVFSAEEKQIFKDQSVEMELDKFKDMTYAEFGKKVKDKIDFSSETQKFSFMYVDNIPPSKPNKEDKDIYADIREKE